MYFGSIISTIDSVFLTFFWFFVYLISIVNKYHIYLILIFRDSIHIKIPLLEVN